LPLSKEQISRLADELFTPEQRVGVAPDQLPGNLNWSLHFMRGFMEATPGPVIELMMHAFVHFALWLRQMKIEDVDGLTSAWKAGQLLGKKTWEGVTK